MESAVDGRRPPKLKVFISFRGRDVRSSFMSILKDTLSKNGVNVQTDDDAIRGKRISANLLKLIRESSIALVIFSKNFSESKWCLDELVEIKKQMDLNKLDPLPIFFAVETSHVKLCGPSRFKENLMRLEDEERRIARQFSIQAVEDVERSFVSWREALESVTDCMGLTYKSEWFDSLKGALVSIFSCLGLPTDNCGQDEAFVDKIVESVLEMLFKIVPQYQVFVSFRGLDVYYKFASSLRAAMTQSHINVFVQKDHSETHSVIRHSRIALVIFTKTFTKSLCCLEELVEIRKCVDNNMIRLIPIFYEVDRRDLILDDQLVEKWNGYEDKINHWKSALAFVATTKNKILYPQNKLEVVFVEEIVQEVKNVLVNILISERASSSAIS